MTPTPPSRERIEFTPGPWEWEANPNAKQCCLTSRSGYVMDFVRWGAGSAAPRFRHEGLMERVESWFRKVAGREHHSHWFQAVDHPDANLMRAAPDLFEALREGRHRVDRLEERHLDGCGCALCAWIKQADAALARALGSEPAREGG